MNDQDDGDETTSYFSGSTSHEFNLIAGTRIVITTLHHYSVGSENITTYLNINNTGYYPIGVRTSMRYNTVQFGHISLFPNWPIELMLVDHSTHGYCWIVTDYIQHQT
jgi:hypothetical protein